jgi:hypothetical protein
MQGQIFRQQWCWKYKNHIAFDYVGGAEFVQDFLHAQFCFLLIDSEANSRNHLSFNHGFL